MPQWKWRWTALTIPTRLQACTVFFLFMCRILYGIHVCNDSFEVVHVLNFLTTAYNDSTVGKNESA